MKVLDLQCALGHRFEGWFSSEDDFVQQLDGGLLECPLCTNKTIHKCLSAPRLHLHAKDQALDCDRAASSHTIPAVSTPSGSEPRAAFERVQQAWLAAARAVMRETQDVGDRFVEEARKMHYGEVPEAAIRGRASGREVLELWEEGVDVLPLPLPDALKNGLQ